MGSIPGLTQWVNDPALPGAVGQVAGAAQIPRCCGSGVGWRLSSDWTPSLGTSICRRISPRNGKKTKRKEKKVTIEFNITTLTVWSHKSWPSKLSIGNQLNKLSSTYTQQGIKKRIGGIFYVLTKMSKYISK